MSAFGDPLKQAREARGVPLDAAAHATRIAQHYLDALERSDLEALPGGPFDKGYIRTYAEFLDIDPQPILERYCAQERQRGRGTPESEQHMLREMSRLIDVRTGPRRNRFHLPLRVVPFASALLVLGLVAGSWFFLRKTVGVEDPTLRKDTRSESRFPLGAPSELRAAGEVPATGDVSSSTATAERPAAKAEAEAHVAPRGDRQTPRTVSADTSPGDVPRVEIRSSAAPDRTGIVVSEFGVGTGVVDRILVGRSTRFPEGARVSFWTRIVDGEPGQLVRHVWLHEGRTAMISELTLGGPHWRTYSRYRLEPGSAGSWAVEARDLAGRLLARGEFLCLPSQDMQSQQ